MDGDKGAGADEPKRPGWQAPKPLAPAPDVVNVDENDDKPKPAPEDAQKPKEEKKKDTQIGYGLYDSLKSSLAPMTGVLNDAGSYVGGKVKDWVMSKMSPTPKDPAQTMDKQAEGPESAAKNAAVGVAKTDAGAAAIGAATGVPPPVVKAVATVAENVDAPTPTSTTPKPGMR